MPGGVARDLDAAALRALAASAASDRGREVATLRAIYDEHAGVQDRFIGAGTVTPELAARLGLTGLAGRASGQAFDLRVDLPCEPYDELDVRKVDAHATATSRRASPCASTKLLESLRLIAADRRRSCRRAASRATLPRRGAGALGVGSIEGWRGDGAGRARSRRGRHASARCHPHDPSWQNWPVLEHAVIGNIVPDFPLINKSFNLSYSGHDL